MQLGATKSDIHLDLWQDFDDELLQSAKNCAEGVIDSIRKHKFWPPAENPDFDDFANFLFGDPEKAVNATNLKATSQS